MTDKELELQQQLAAKDAELERVRAERQWLYATLSAYQTPEHIDAHLSAALSSPVAEPGPPQFTCKYCGAPSYLEPIDQSPPVDYCHESDHGNPEDQQS